jgi:hypothetical protein
MSDVRDVHPADGTLVDARPDRLAVSGAVAFTALEGPQSAGFTAFVIKQCAFESNALPNRSDPRCVSVPIRGLSRRLNAWGGSTRVKSYPASVQHGNSPLPHDFLTLHRHT